MSGDVAVVGADLNDSTGGTYAGAVYVYRFNGTTWEDEVKLEASDGAPSDYFGGSVSICGDIALIGADGEDNSGGANAGAAYVFRFNGSIWAQEAKLQASDGAEGDGFGNHVSVSENLAVVGAPNDDNERGTASGAAYVYRFNGTTWVEEAKLIASDGADGDHLGERVAVSDDVAVIGASSDDNAGGVNAGAAYVFRFNGASWLEEAKILAPDGASNDHFGRGVSTVGTAILVGASYHDSEKGSEAGAAYTFTLDE